MPIRQLYRYSICSRTATAGKHDRWYLWRSKFVDLQLTLWCLLQQIRLVWFRARRLWCWMVSSLVWKKVYTDKVLSQSQWGQCNGTIVSTTSKAISSGITSSKAISKTNTPTLTTNTGIFTTTSATITATNFAALPTCGQTCFNNMLAQASSLGCTADDSYCLCNNIYFGIGFTECSNGACGTDVAAIALAYESVYCAQATSKHQATTTTAFASLPSCGQTCFTDIVAQASALGCAAADDYCLCNYSDFSKGMVECSDGACGTDIAPVILAYQAAWCSVATSNYQATATGYAALPACGRTCFDNMLAQYKVLGCASAIPSCLCSNVYFGSGLNDWYVTPFSLSQYRT